METTKHDFGRFVADHRRDAGLTQRELAARLHVTESAVSKWERGRSYPDITVVPILAQTLGVSSDELMNASEDPEARFERRDARSYRAWRSALLWSTSIAYGATLATTFIVNLAVPPHALSWFWIVCLAVALAFSLTTLPLLPIPTRGWVVLAASTLSLFGLFAVAAASGGSGTWVPIAISAVLLALVIVFGPIWLATAGLPMPVDRHLTVLALLADTIALAAFLFVLFLSIGRLDLWLTPALAIAGIAVFPVWVVALACRYFPLRGAYTTAFAVVFVGVYGFFADSLIATVSGVAAQDRAFDLSRWDDAYLTGNIAVLTVAGCVLLALGLVAIGVLMGARERARGLEGTGAITAHAPVG